MPSAPGTMPAATAAAEPEDEPPGVCSRLRGLCVLPGVKVASSVVTVLPMMTAPARRSAVMQAASAAGCRPSWARQPFSVGMSEVSMMSLMPTGTPCSGPTPLPSLRRLSAARACSSARSRSRKVQACTCGSSAAMRSRQAPTSSSELVSLRAIRAAAAVTVRSVRLVSVNGVFFRGCVPAARDRSPTQLP